MLFEDALRAMREGKKVQRSIWKRQHFKMKQCMFDENDALKDTFDLSTTDVLAEDWEILPEPSQEDGA